MNDEVLLSAVAAASAANRAALRAAESAAAEQRAAIYAALDAGVSISAVYRTAEISRTRINTMIKEREKCSASEDLLSD
ncbi:hypothetical protein [Rhodococcoides kyotonense]|uniref:hypothetical protein n=1 Tax=Rhodococcoides kyotonense TaxID=398843 RepID=UPI00113287B7|nr:hypothetical protein [Rhodococcus kyotonensis]